MNKKEKTLIINALTYNNSPSFWGINNVKNYLRELQKGFNEVLITVKPEELRNRIFQWIDKCDPKLEKFLQFNKVIEYEKGKTCQLFEIPPSLTKEIDGIVKKQQETPYDPISMGDWDHPKLVFSCRKENSFEMWYAVKASKRATKAFDFDKLPNNIQNDLYSVLQKAVPDIDELEKILLEYNIFNRIINIIRFDTKNKVVSISTDQPKLIDPDDSERNIIRPEDRLGPIFDKILVSLGLPKEGARKIAEKKKVNTTTVKRIKPVETKKLLLFPFRFDIIHKEGDLTAANITRFTQLTEKNIMPLVVEYYQNNKTFEKFFDKYSNFDAQKNSTLLHTLYSLSSTEDEAEGFLLFIVVDSNVHVARVICNITTGSLRIFLEKGNGSYEYIAAELDKIFS